MLTSGRYKGNPMLAHLKHKPRLTPALFERWLALWRETTAEAMTPEAAIALQVKAARIAASLQFALGVRPGLTPNAVKTSAGSTRGASLERRRRLRV